MIDSIREKIRKIQALAEQGIGGEKEDAKRILQRLLAKHKLTLEDLPKLGQDATELYYFRCTGEVERSLLRQCYLYVVPDGEPYYFTRHGRKTIGFKLTYLQYLELKNYWDYYRQLWKQELGLFYQAFLYKHRIFRKSSSTESSPASASLTDEEIKRILRMMLGLSDSGYVPARKLLGS